MSYLTAINAMDSDGFFSWNRPKALLRVSGDDALAFLQGQFTQELRVPAGMRCAYGLWLNQKGKVVADSFALRDGPSWWLVSFGSPADVIQARLEGYIIADDVVVEDVTPLWSGAVLVGKTATSQLQNKGMVLPVAGAWAWTHGGLIFRGRRGADESWEWLSPDGSAGLQTLLADGLREGSLNELERARILAGIPTVPLDVGPWDLPNEGGLEKEAISYSKGCYLGQEVMARLKSMGQVRRRLMRVRGRGEAPVSPSGVFLETKKVGEIRSAVTEENGDTFIGLAMISLIGLGTAQRLSLEPGGEPAIDVLPTLP